MCLGNVRMAIFKLNIASEKGMVIYMIKNQIIVTFLHQERLLFSILF